MRQFLFICKSLEAIEKHRNTSIGKVTQNLAGNLSESIFPNNTIVGLLFSDITEKTLETNLASIYKNPAHHGKVLLV